MTKSINIASIVSPSKFVPNTIVNMLYKSGNKLVDIRCRIIAVSKDGKSVLVFILKEE